jgi:hypothetical protein
MTGYQFFNLDDLFLATDERSQQGGQVVEDSFLWRE